MHGMQDFPISPAVGHTSTTCTGATSNHSPADEHACGLAARMAPKAQDRCTGTITYAASLRQLYDVCLNKCFEHTWQAEP